MLRTLRLSVRESGGSAENMVALRAALQSFSPSERVDVCLTVTGCPFAALWNEIASIYDFNGAEAPNADIVVLLGEGAASSPRMCRRPVEVNIPWDYRKGALSPDDKKVVTYCLLIGAVSLRVPPGALKLIRRFVAMFGYSDVEVISPMGGHGEDEEEVRIFSVGIAPDSSIVVPEAEDSVGCGRQSTRAR